MLDIIFSSTIIALCYGILIRQGELLQWWARFVNFSDMPQKGKKLFLCPYCMAGQIAFFQCLFYGHFMAIPVVIVLVYVIVNVLHIYESK